MSQQSKIDNQEFADIIFGDKVEKRTKWMEILKDPKFQDQNVGGIKGKIINKILVFVPRWNVSLSETRDRAYNMLSKVTSSKLVSVTDFIHDPTNIFTANWFQEIQYFTELLSHEFLGQVNPSTGTKFTVQFNLFGGTIVGLHTERHKFLFPKIDDLSIMGCFCLTEFYL